MEIIHIVLGKVNPNRLNGVNKVVHQIAHQQVLAGKKVTVFGISKTGKNQEQTTPFPLTIFQSFKNPFQLDKDLKKRILEKREDSIFILHGSWIPRFYSISHFIRKNNCQYIAMQHGGYNVEAMQKSKFMKALYFQAFEKHLLAGASSIHCIGKSEIQGLKSIGFEAKSELIPYGFDQVYDAIKDVKKSNSTFCYMGRIDIHTKGLDLLLSSFKEVQNIQPEAKLWIIGSGDGLDEMKTQVQENGLNENVVFWGPLFENEKFDLMSKANVFVHPSRFEGLPSAILEAASIGLPIIATTATNMTSYIAKYNAGWWIQNESTSSLTSAMINSISEPNSVNLEKGRNAKVMVNSEFAWDKILLQMDKMYENAIKK